MIGIVLAAALAAAPSETTTRELTLDEALALAAKSQPQLAQARAQVVAAEARADVVGAAYLPQIDVLASYALGTHNGLPRPVLQRTPQGQVVLTGGPTWDTAAAWTFSATASQLIWDFGRSLSAIRAAGLSAEAERLTERFSVIAVAVNVRVAFFVARSDRDLVDVAATTLQNQQAHLAQIKGLVDVGKRPEVDLSQARADVANARVQMIRSTNAYATAKSQLDQAMGVRAPFPYEVAGEGLGPVEGESAPVGDLVEVAIGGRPDLEALATQVRAQEALASAARGAYWPSLGASVTASDRSVPGFEGLGELTPNAFGLLTLTWNLYQGGATMATVREADALASSLRAQLDVQKLQVRVEVEQAWLAVHAALEAQVAAKEAVEAARDRLRLAEGRYQAGVGTALELSDAQSFLTLAEAQLVGAVSTVSTARAQLLFALGRA